MTIGAGLEDTETAARKSNATLGTVFLIDDTAVTCQVASMAGMGDASELSGQAETSAGETLSAGQYLVARHPGAGPGGPMARGDEEDRSSNQWTGRGSYGSDAQQPETAGLPAPNTLIYYYVWDQVGSVRMIADKDGLKRETHDYAPYGLAISEPGAGVLIGVSSLIRYAGQERDYMNAARRHQHHGLHALQVLRGRHRPVHETRQHHGQHRQPSELEPVQLRPGRPHRLPRPQRACRNTHTRAWRWTPNGLSGMDWRRVLGFVPRSAAATRSGRDVRRRGQLGRVGFRRGSHLLRRNEGVDNHRPWRRAYDVAVQPKGRPFGLDIQPRWPVSGLLLHDD